MKKMYLSITVLFLVGVSKVLAHEYGSLATCPGSELPAVFTDRFLNKHMHVVIQRHIPLGVYRKRYTFDKAAHGIGTDPNIDFQNRKTMLYMDGYLDSSNLPTTRIATGLYAKEGYNTITLETQKAYSFVFPVAARIARAVGNVTAVLLNNLMKYGLNPRDVELVGLSLGAQTVSFVGKSFYKLSGKKIGRIVSQDISGPCYRELSAEYRLTPTDADFVQAIHTNTEGFAMLGPVGHVDFYMNGGEYQHLIENYQPWCEDLCSHVLSFVYYFTAFSVHSDKFVGVRCKDVQQARQHRCYDNLPHDTNIMGIKTNTSNHGIFYIPVSGDAPFFAPEDFIEKRLNYDLEYADAFSHLDNILLS